ncbi:MAG: hypothetical protein Q4G69_06440 [Planctomycetia bacterium]|nr:hypothetical protein [Planctomycetia bacterium]
MGKYFNRDLLNILPLSDRVNKLDVKRDTIDPVSYKIDLSEEAADDVRRAAEEIRSAKENGAARILAFGAHSIKNGLGSVLIRLLQRGWITHFATNGAGVIHDWEFAFQGKSGEDVHRYTSEGQFGIWNETGTCINLAIIAGAFFGLGYGEAVGSMIQREGILLPSDEELRKIIDEAAKSSAAPDLLDRAAAAADLLRKKTAFDLKEDFIKISHPFREFSLAYSAVDAHIPFTCHPMFGHDIIYTHPMNDGAAIGRCAQRDFLSYANSVSQLEKGVYLSVGSAVMSPMIFEKSLSMSRNIARQEGKEIERFTIHVVDLAKSSWDWTRNGEPPMDNPAYYLRFCKTFSRMGGKMSYCSADNRSWLTALLQELEK